MAAFAGLICQVRYMPRLGPVATELREVGPLGKSGYVSRIRPRPIGDRHIWPNTRQAYCRDQSSSVPPVTGFAGAAWPDL